VTTGIFQRAIDILINERALIGTVERFDESFNYISKKLSEFFPEVDFVYERKNVTSQLSIDEKFRQAVDQLLPVLAQVVDRNAYDLALYRAVNEKLDSLVR
jgi:hypothetical protein